jgi:hypothetical protein
MAGDRRDEDEVEDDVTLRWDETDAAPLKTEAAPSQREISLDCWVPTFLRGELKP